MTSSRTEAERSITPSRSRARPRARPRRRASRRRSSRRARRRRGHVAVGLRIGDPDPVGDLEAGVLAHLLDRADHVANDALELQLRRDLGVECDGEPVAVGDGEALAGARPQLELARLEHPVTDVDAAVAELELALAQEPADDGELAAVLGAEQLQERHHLDLGELLGRGREAHALHPELGGDQLDVLGHVARRTGSSVATMTSRSGWRSLMFGPRTRRGGRARPRRGRSPSPRPGGVGELVAHLRVAGQVHARGASGQTPRTRFCHISSVRNGITGETQRIACTSAYHSVSKAARVSPGSSERQKRVRDRRTYQLERSSMNVSNARTSRGESQLSSAARHSAHQPLRAGDEPAVERLRPSGPGPAASS